MDGTAVNDAANRAVDSGEFRFSLLGPVRAWQADTEVSLGAAQQRAVLAVLL